MNLKFRKKPIVIEAMKFSGGNHGDIIEFTGDAAFLARTGLFISSDEGDMHVASGDWVIKGIKGEFYPCKPDIFEGTYEPVVADE